MSIDEALKIAKKELGVEEMPIDPKKRKEIAFIASFNVFVAFYTSE